MNCVRRESAYQPRGRHLTLYLSEFSRSAMACSTGLASRLSSLVHRVSKKRFSFNATDHQMDHRHIDRRLTARCEVFIVFAQPAVFAKPAEGAFHYPSFGQEHKAFGLIRALDD